jgi:serine O-acetyltransferase
LKLSLSQDELAAYVDRQLDRVFPDGRTGVADCIEPALQRVEFCFSHVNNKYFHDDEQTIFSHLHSDQYAMFLYFLSNTIWQSGNAKQLADKVYYLNKMLHAVDIFYEVALPDIFLLSHPLGTVLGRGSYADYFVAYQNCTVGSNLAGEYPIFAEGVAVFGGSAIIGDCSLGQNTWVAAGTQVKDQKFPGDSVVFGRYPQVGHKSTKRRVADHFFKSPGNVRAV